MSRAIRAVSVGVVTGAVVALSATSALPAPAPQTERVTVSATREQSNGGSGAPALSADGRYAAFASYGSNLVPGDTNDASDIFVRDLRKGTVERVSVASDGTQADGASHGVTISGNGRYVVFVSSAGNLVAGDELPARSSNVYVHDRRTGRTERVSRGADGGTASVYGKIAVSHNGRYVVFNAPAGRMEAGETNFHLAAYVTDRRTGETRRISNRTQPEWSVFSLDISADGRYVAYLQRHPRGGRGELWVFDCRTGTEELANVTPEGTPSTGDAVSVSLSADGSLVAFSTGAHDVGGGPGPNSTSGYVRDLRADTTRRIDHDRPGREAFLGTVVLSPDGRYVAYPYGAPTAGGDFVDNLYVQDLRTGKSRLVSVTTGGGPVTDDHFTLPMSFSRDGRLLIFISSSAQLVPDDTNGQADGFVRRLR
ncbi:TolB-like translocation protein [Streptomyces jeddahensis]|uniref:Protein TolB n=1 Tax=Streptomyces jeddahensis TaxID=1716141 RepID=A0A177HVI0_9ACTN|nr:PD40 domain-containing protein [Streptomyces jeddahensis]OAH14639.1 protein TolB [Streptomyces jeddahensis]